MVTGLHGALSDLAANLVMEGRSTVEEAVAIHLLPMVAEAAVGRGTNQTLATHTHAQLTVTGRLGARLDRAVKPVGEGCSTEKEPATIHLHPVGARIAKDHCTNQIHVTRKHAQAVETSRNINSAKL